MCHDPTHSHSTIDSHHRTVAGERLEDGSLHSAHHRRWSRRQFLRGIGLGTAGAAITLGGIPVRSYGASPLLNHLRQSSGDRILVVVQLSGGNDGLNTVVPYANDMYYQYRPGISLGANNVLPLNTEIGLHPSLTHFSSLYSSGAMQVVQGVGYADPDLSHFQSTDVWATASPADDLATTGWLGRYLESEMPSFVDDPPEYPLAVQLGNGTPLLFQGEQAGMGVQFPNLDLLQRFFDTGQLYDESFVPATPYGDELAFVRSIANDSIQYAEALSDASNAGANLTEYPAVNGFSGNLATAARLIRGGLGASMYHINLGGFDTHSNQLNRHAVLMNELSTALGAFMADLQSDEWDKRVVVMTFSEFGRRVYQNGSGGTDHGTAAPLFLLGGGISGGIHGDHPSLSDLDAGGNMKYGVDFRSVYGSLLSDWFGMAREDVHTIMGGEYAHLPLIDSSYATYSEPVQVPQRTVALQNYPNPFQSDTTLEFTLESSGHASLHVFDVNGRQVRTLLDARLGPGTHSVVLHGAGLPAGTYFARLIHAGHSSTQALTRLP
jgi:uncharacterized protein (DUF1501 family)